MEDSNLKKEVVALLELEVGIYQMRVTRLNSELQQYFNSSSLRHVMARIMTLATLHKKPLTISEIVAVTYATRQAISALIKDCLGRGYIEIIDQGDFKKRYQATKLLLDATKQYTDARMRLAIETMDKHKITPAWSIVTNNPTTKDKVGKALA